MPPPQPPEKKASSVLRVPKSSVYRSASSYPSRSTRNSSQSTCAALIVTQPMAPTPIQPAENVGFRTSCAETVSLPTCLNPRAPCLAAPHAPPAVVHTTRMADENPARLQPQPISETSLAPHTYVSSGQVALGPTSTDTGYDFPDGLHQFTDLDDISLFGDGGHDQYAPLYDDFLTTDFTTTTCNTVPQEPYVSMTDMTTLQTPDPFIEAASVPSTTMDHAVAAQRTEDEILANFDTGLADLEKDVDIGQWLKYLQDDGQEVMIPGMMEENIFERVDQEPTTPESMSGQQAGDYFTVPSMPSTSRYIAESEMMAQSSTAELDPVQEFFPEMCVEVGQAQVMDYGMASGQEWQYQQYSPSHSPESTFSSSTCSNYEPASIKTNVRKRPYPAPSVASSVYDDDYRAKRDKNNRASQISRQKHKDKVDAQKKEVVELAARNEALKLEVEALEQQIATMRTVLMDSLGTAQK